MNIDTKNTLLTPNQFFKNILLLAPIFLIWVFFFRTFIPAFSLNDTFSNLHKNMEHHNIALKEVISSHSLNEISFTLPKNDKIIQVIADPNEANYTLNDDKLFISPLLPAGNTININVKTLYGKNIHLDLNVADKEVRNINYPEDFIKGNIKDDLIFLFFIGGFLVATAKMMGSILSTIQNMTLKSGFLNILKYICLISAFLIILIFFLGALGLLIAWRLQMIA